MITLISRLTAPFHRELASPAWLEALRLHVENALRERAEFQTSDGSGEVTSQYSEPRYMGPNSAVKYHFFVNIKVQRTDSRSLDQYQVHVRYLPGDHMFETRSEWVDTLEMRASEREKKAQRNIAREAAVRQLADKCENREAIYIGGGVARVRVTGIRARGFDALARGLQLVEADLEEIPTVGLRNSFIQSRLGDTRPLKWCIETSMRRIESDSTWTAFRSGGWSLRFDPRIVQGVVGLAARWPDDMPPLARYCEVGRLLME